MISRFFKMGTRFGQQLGQHISNLSDPIVGHTMIRLQKPSLLIRVDGRSLNELQKLNGFHPRTDIEQVKYVRSSQVQDYQDHNINPFAWGACSSLKDLMT